MRSPRALVAALSLLLLVPTGVAVAADPAPVALPAVSPLVTTDDDATPATATAVQPGSRTRGQVFPAADVDVYRFHAPAGARVYAAVVTSGATSSTDSVLTLLGADGSTVLETDDDNGSLSSLSSSIAGATVPGAGTYYLRVAAKGPTQTIHQYDLYLDVHVGATTGEVEPDDQSSQASPAQPEVAGVRGTPSDVDYYALPLEAGDTVFLSLDLDPERDGVATDLRLGLGLLGDDRNRIQVVDDAGTGDTSTPAIPSEALALTVAAAGTYYGYVDAAGSAGDATSTYRLSTTVLHGADATCRTYTTTPTDGAIPDLGTATFPIPVTDPARIDRLAVRVDLTHPAMADLDAVLTSPGGSTVALFDDIGATSAGGQSRLDSTFDTWAATPATSTLLRPLVLRPDAGDLEWWRGNQASGVWKLTLRDDGATHAGTLASVGLVVCPEEQEPTDVDPIYSADFENDSGGFTTSGTADEWERGLPSTLDSGSVAGLAACGGGSGCFKTDLDGGYDASSDQTLLSPPIDLTGRTGVITAAWDMWWQLESAVFDTFEVSVEEVGGGSPRTLFRWTGPTMSVNHGSPAVAVPESAGWGRHVADLSSYAGTTVRLRFHLTSDTSAQYAGLAVDDVAVYQPVATLAVTKDGTGGGTVTSTPAAIACGTTCSAEVAVGTTLTLTAAPAAGSAFAGWTGCPAPSGATCSVTAGDDTTVSARFDRLPVPTLGATATRKAGGRATVSCGTGPCTVAVVSGIVRAGTTTLGRLGVPAPFALAASTKVTRTLPASSRLKQAMKASRKPVKVTITATFTYAGGRQVTRTATVTAT